MGHGHCHLHISPTCAMAAAFLRPGCLKGKGQPDDRYLAIVQRHGNTPLCQQKRRLRGACFPEMPARSSRYFLPCLPLQRQQAAQTAESPKL